MDIHRPRLACNPSYRDVLSNCSTIYRTIQPAKNVDYWNRAPAPIGTRRNPFNNISFLSDYALIRKISEGSYGIVYQAIHKMSGTIVALKQMKNEIGKTGLPAAAVTEIELLFAMNHPSILRVMEVVRGEDPGDFYLAMELMEMDLKQFLKSKLQGLTIAEVKGLMLQLLEGVSFLHRNILHRDLKTANVLLNREGKLKICDFGLACWDRKDGTPLNSLVVTLWYRAPELILGSTQYSSEIDMWSVGCIMGELLGNEPLFQGRTELDQLCSIVDVLGIPSINDCISLPMLTRLSFMNQPHNLLWLIFPTLSNLGVDLLERLLSYDPRNRITAAAAMNHPWFRESPLPE